MRHKIYGDTMFATILRTSLLTGAITLSGAIAQAQGGRGGVPQDAPPPATQQSPTGPVRVSSGVVAANILTKVAPLYPQAAKEARVQGAVVLAVIIGKDGAVKQISIVSGPDLLQQSAVDAVSRWTYRPTILNGAPADIITEITVNYTLL